MSATLRYRGDKNNIIELAKNLDAFKKVPEKYTETTEIGGTLSLLSRLLIIYLIYKEVRYYQDANLSYQFEPDIDMDEKVQMHVDITVAMPCESFSGVDLIDETQQDIFEYAQLQREATWWKMNEDEREQFEHMQYMNAFLREEYHSVANILFKDIIKSNEVHDVPTAKGKKKSEEKYDACRLHGSLGIHKVAGILHLVGGAQSIIDLSQDLWKIEFVKLQTNFTHRINRLSFGQYSRRIVQPLEGDETLVADEDTTVQYFIKIVPTVIYNSFSTINTFQYSVTENVRKLDSDISSMSRPGIYFKYDWSALKIIVRTDRENIVKFIIRLCSIIAGVVVISGILNTLLATTQRTIISTFAPQFLYKTLKHDLNSGTNVVTTAAVVGATPIPTKPAANDLISIANKMSTDNNDSSIPTATFVPINGDK